VNWNKMKNLLNPGILGFLVRVAPNQWSRRQSKKFRLFFMKELKTLVNTLYLKENLILLSIGFNG